MSYSGIGIAGQIVKWSLAGEQVSVHGHINTFASSVGSRVAISIQGYKGAIKQGLVKTLRPLIRSRWISRGAND